MTVEGIIEEAIVEENARERKEIEIWIDRQFFPKHIVFQYSEI